MARLRKSKGKQRKNLFLANVSGHIGKQFVIKQYKNFVTVSNFPDMSGVKPSVKQKTGRTLFKKAVSYAKNVLKDPEEKAAYARKLKGKRTVYHAVISDFMESNKNEAVPIGRQIKGKAKKK